MESFLKLKCPVLHVVVALLITALTACSLPLDQAHPPAQQSRPPSDAGVSNPSDPPPGNADAHSCDAGAATACASLAKLYLRGTNVPRDARRAADLFSRSCHLGSVTGCIGLGSLYEAGIGLPRDGGRASVLYKNACDANARTGCLRLGLLFLNGSGVAQDTVAADRLLEHACTGFVDSFECELVASIYESGQGTWDGLEVPRDAVRAKALYAAACAGGYSAACQRH